MEAISSMFSSGAAASAGEAAASEGALAEGAMGAGEAAATYSPALATEAATEAAASASPGFWGTIASGVQSVMPYVKDASQIINLANMAKNAISGGPGQPQTPTSQSTAPLTPPVAPTSGGVSPSDYESQQKAYWNQLFAGTGQGLPGGELPQDIQDMIARNAALLR